MSEYDWDFDFANIGQFYECFVRHGSLNAVEQCLEFCDANSSELISDENGFSELPYSLVTALVGRRSFCAREADVANAVIHWYQKHNDYDLNELLKHMSWNLNSKNKFLHRIYSLGVITNKQYSEFTANKNYKYISQLYEGNACGSGNNSNASNGNENGKLPASPDLPPDEEDLLFAWIFDQQLRKYVCQVCETKFSKKQNVQRHMYIHLEANFNCSLCDKKYKTRELLRDHEKGHEVNFTCYRCGKCDFSLMSSITRHRRESCRGASKSTARIKLKTAAIYRGVSYKTQSATKQIVGRYIRHLRTKQNACKLCDKRYNTLHELRDHNKAHAVNFTCDDCGKPEFTLFSSIKKHKMTNCDKRLQN